MRIWLSHSKGKCGYAFLCICNCCITLEGNRLFLLLLLNIDRKLYVVAEKPEKQTDFFFSLSKMHFHSLLSLLYMTNTGEPWNCISQTHFLQEPGCNLQPATYSFIQCLLEERQKLLLSSSGSSGQICGMRQMRSVVITIGVPMLVTRLHATKQ